MTLPAFFKTLHFRISALFLLLLSISAAGYYYWINATVLGVDSVPGEDEWYEELAEGQLDSLALELLPRLDDRDTADTLLEQYGAGVGKFDVEVTLLDQGGFLISSTQPDSLSRVLLNVDPALLDSMATDQWDFGSYPNPYNIDAYENRIFDVSPLWTEPDSVGPPEAYLVASFTPLEITVDDYAGFERRLWLQAIVVILIAAAASGLILMAWLSRRIHSLNLGVNTFSEGDLDYRIPVRSNDEIGALGRTFNAMASRLATLIERLRQSERFHRRLVANISHDLRTPMASLRGYVETLILKGDDLSPADQERYLGIIAANLDHLEKLIHHTLKLSQLDSGQAKFRMESFQLEELLNEVVDRMRGMAAEKGVALESACEPAVPDVFADPLQIGQVLQNLIENGVKFNRPGGLVEVRLRPGDREVEVEVFDTGEGIPAEDLPHVCERFYTGDKSRSQKGQGSGLGLAITERILAGHGRSLAVQSNPGQGTSFRFTLPAAGEQDPDESALEAGGTP